MANRQETHSAKANNAPKSALSQFETLPGTVLVHIFGQGLLIASDVENCINLSHSTAEWFKKNSESIPVWRRFLQEEELEGETYEDWAIQMRPWNTLCTELASAYRLLPSPATGLTIAQENAQENMAQRIANFIIRVAGHHSWYKHLPITTGVTSFELYLDLNSRMRWDRKKKKWIEYTKNDGTQFHYTWMTTEKYRRLFGYFDWRLQDQQYPHTAGDCDVSRVGVPHAQYDKQKVIQIPKSFRCRKVQVTSAVHTNSPSYDLYYDVLKTAVEQRDPDFVKGPVPGECLTVFSRRRFQPDGKLPSPAALDLEKIVKHILKGSPISDLDSPESMELGCEIIVSAYPNVAEFRDPREIAHETMKNAGRSYPIHAFATLALVAQQWREMIAIGYSLEDLCLQVYGSKLTPPSSIVQRKIISNCLGA
mmetsp:Transcript_14969/g.21387  ORF Transcript_14969/g.21387 Transcript_14969/m.21387 type:complete len:423 (+) Transcript_14969:135-1403(+)